MEGRGIVCSISVQRQVVGPFERGHGHLRGEFIDYLRNR